MHCNIVRFLEAVGDHGGCPLKSLESWSNKATWQVDWQICAILSQTCVIEVSHYVHFETENSYTLSLLKFNIHTWWPCSSRKSIWSLWFLISCHFWPISDSINSPISVWPFALRSTNSCSSSSYFNLIDFSCKHNKNTRLRLSPDWKWNPLAKRL